MDKIVKGALQSDEKIIWEGKPEIGVFIMGRKIDSLIIGGFIIYSAIVIMIRTFDQFIPLDKLVVGPLFYLLFFWLILNFPKMRTRYLITDKRVLLITDIYIWRHVSQVFLNRLQRVGKNIFPGAKFGSIDGDEISFHDIKDVENAYGVLNNLLNTRQ